MCSWQVGTAPPPGCWVQDPGVPQDTVRPTEPPHSWATCPLAVLCDPVSPEPRCPAWSPGKNSEEVWLSLPWGPRGPGRGRCPPSPGCPAPSLRECSPSGLFGRRAQSRQQPDPVPAHAPTWTDRRPPRLTGSIEGPKGAAPEHPGVSRPLGPQQLPAAQAGPRGFRAQRRRSLACEPGASPAVPCRGGLHSCSGSRSCPQGELVPSGDRALVAVGECIQGWCSSWLPPCLPGASPDTRLLSAGAGGSSGLGVIPVWECPSLDTVSKKDTCSPFVGGQAQGEGTLGPTTPVSGSPGWVRCLF
ncbi:uncharacterized protein LOC114675007 isoform X1 [Macaca mulatta]|uniref:uncharacterized protein LOC106995373 n=1 Tax=Macaca mulatta TaxID=9544 RepID=UPI000732B4C0|nr:uncharacterized protein LOC106995373 [Macaca mulatta]XP_028698157.1 uncharacterized protein LOC114675007 [Macaca mulatta]